MLKLAQKHKREAEEAKLAEEEAEKAKLREEADIERRKWEKLEEEAMRKEAEEKYTYEQEEYDKYNYNYDYNYNEQTEGDDDDDIEMSDIDILFQFIPFYGQGDPTNDATVRAYLSGLSIGDIDCKDEYGNTLLLLACQHGLDDLVRIMLNKGADPNATNSSGASGLHFACYRESLNKTIAKMLLHNGANPDLVETANGCTPLHYASSTGDVSLCELLVRYGANVGVQDYYNYTCADYARDGNWDNVATFLQNTLLSGPGSNFGSPGGASMMSGSYSSPTNGYNYSHTPTRGGMMMNHAGGNEVFFNDGNVGMSTNSNNGTPSAAMVAANAANDAAVKAALAEAEDKHKAALEDTRMNFRKELTEREDKISQLSTDRETLIGEIESMKKEIDENTKILERAEQSGARSIETVDAELLTLRAENKELSTQKGVLEGNLNKITIQIDDIESKLGSVSAADKQRVEEERKAAEERLIIQRERETIFASEVETAESKYRNEANILKDQLAELKKETAQEQRATANKRGAIQRELEKRSEAARRTLHETKTRTAKEMQSAQFTREDAERSAETATVQRNKAVHELESVKKDIADSKEAESFNEEIRGYIIKEQSVRRSLHNQMEDLKGKIRVYVRVRPMSKKEKGRDCKEVATKEGKNGLQLKMPDTSKTYDFDQVFAGLQDNTQEDIFRDTKHLVMSVIDGYNVCIFAYGQTGSGKTYTMIGGCEIGESVKEDGDFHEAAGIAPRAVSELFRLLQERKDQMEFTVDVTMFQVYRDGLQDLLSKPTKNKKNKKGDDDDDKQIALKITLAQHSATGLVQVEGAEIRSASTANEVMQIFAEGSARRKVASTQMNAESSRSHLICSLVTNITSKRSGKKTSGKLTLVDLAGSERVEKSGASGEALKEAQSINKSLSALGDVISSLTSNSQHVPYRNHTLTMLMSDSIGGNAKTLMFVNASPADYNVSETNSSLSFGNRCKDITNAVAAPPHVQAQQLKALQKELAKMKKDGKKEGKNLGKPGK